MSAVTNQAVDNRIDTVTYYRPPGTTVTICQIKMVNGFVVLGESSCVNPADFDQEKGESIAHENAREKLWPLEGYLAAERRYQGEAGESMEDSCAYAIENFSLSEKMEWLFSQPISRFSKLNLNIVTGLWCATEGYVSRAYEFSPGVRACIHGVFEETMQARCAE